MGSLPSTLTLLSNKPENEMKSIFKSKTAVFNFLVALAGTVAFFVPEAKPLIEDNSVILMGAIGVINIALRYVTKERVVLFPA